MHTVGDFYDAINSFAPFSTAEKWDNVGLLIGGRELAVSSALLALDLTGAVLDEAKRLQAELVITHHPVIMDKLGAVEADSIVYRTIAAGVSVISAHTNLDIAQGGVNDALASRLGLRNIRPITQPSGDILETHALHQTLSLGRMGEIDPLSSSQLARLVRERLGAAGVRCVDGGREITAVAVCGGSGGGLVRAAQAAGAQALVTGDVKHHQLLEAAELGLTLVDAGHFATENVVMEPLRLRIAERLPGAVMTVSSSCTDGAQYVV